MYIGCAFSILIHGFFSDYLGRTFSIFSAQTLVMAGALLCVFSNDPSEFFLATTILSLGLGSSIMLCRILAYDLFQGPNFIQAISFISLCTLAIPPFSPWIAEWFFPIGHWKSLFLGLFVIVFVSFMTLRINLRSQRLRRQMNTHCAHWDLKALYRPSIGLSVAFALINALTVFLYQSAISLIISPQFYSFFFIVPTLGAIVSTISFFFSKSWSGSLYPYIKKRYILASVLALSAAFSWNIFQQPIAFAICMFGVFSLQSNILALATARLLQEPLPIGLSASLVSFAYHLVRGLAIIAAPLALKNSPKDLLISIALLMLFCMPIVQAARYCDRHRIATGQGRENLGALS
jgi:MFS family permease